MNALIMLKPFFNVIFTFYILIYFRKKKNKIAYQINIDDNGTPISMQMLQRKVFIRNNIEGSPQISYAADNSQINWTAKWWIHYGWSAAFPGKHSSDQSNDPSPLDHSKRLGKILFLTIILNRFLPIFTDFKLLQQWANKQNIRFK